MTEQVRYRLEQRLVREAKKVCDELGLSPSQVVSMTFAQLVRLRALPFRPSEFPALEEYGVTLAEADAAEERALREIARDRRAGKVVQFTGKLPWSGLTSALASHVQPASWAIKSRLKLRKGLGSYPGISASPTGTVALDCANLAGAPTRPESREGCASCSSEKRTGSRLMT